MPGWPSRAAASASRRARSACPASAVARRLRAGGARSPADPQQLLVRRAAGLGGVVLVLILLFFGIKGCATSAKKNSLRDYNTDVASLARESDTQVARPFFQLLGAAGRSSPVNVESQINDYRAAAEDQAKRARATDVLDQLAEA